MLLPDQYPIKQPGMKRQGYRKRWGVLASTDRPKQHPRSRELALPSPRRRSSARGGLGSPCTGRPPAERAAAPGWRHRPLAPGGPTAIPAPDSAMIRQQLRASAAPTPLQAPAGSRPGCASAGGGCGAGRAAAPALRCRSHFAGAAGLGIPGARGSLASSSSSFPTSFGAGRMMAAATVAEVNSTGSSSADTSSTGEEERMRRLFQTCDGDGDGFISR
nr:transcription initiation factor TFIID subunit 4-like [Taeniopygia guttata]